MVQTFKTSPKIPYQQPIARFPIIDDYAVCFCPSTRSSENDQVLQGRTPRGVIRPLLEYVQVRVEPTGRGFGIYRPNPSCFLPNWMPTPDPETASSHFIHDIIPIRKWECFPDQPFRHIPANFLQMSSKALYVIEVTLFGWLFFSTSGFNQPKVPEDYLLH